MRATRRLLLLVLSVLAAACAGPEGIPARSAWMPVTRFEDRLPPSLRLYALEDDHYGLRAWYVRADLGDGALRCEVLLAEGDGLETVSEIAARTGACVAVNGGFFRVDDSGVGRPRHAVLVDGELRPASGDGGAATQGAALGVTAGGGVDVAWVRCGADGLVELPDRSGRAFVGPARKAAPSGASRWGATDALLSGPLLLFEGTACEPWEYDPPRHPRTAAGITADGALILLVVDGRQRASRGASFAELTALLADLGCVEAINLDGGGSSTLVVRGERLNRPQGGRTERPVASAVALFCDGP